MKQARVFSIVLLSVLMVACSPEYNWREVAVDDTVGLVLFPDKPRTQTRALDFSGYEVVFRLTAAEAGKTTFAVGYAPWPEPMAADASLRHSMGQAVIASLYGNFGHEAPAELPDFGERFEISGAKVGGMLLQGQVWLSPTGLVEGLAVGPADNFPHESAKQFLDSVAQGRQ